MWHNNELERAKRSFWAIGAAGAQVPYKHKAGGSNPSSPTTNSETSSDGGLFHFWGAVRGFEPRSKASLCSKDDPRNKVFVSWFCSDMPLLCCKLMRLSGARPFGSTSFPVPASLVPTLSGLLFGSSRRPPCRKNDAKTPKSTVGGRSIPRKSGAARFRFVSGAHDLGFCKPGIHYM